MSNPVPRPSQPQSRPEQWDRADLAAATPEQIEAARIAGQLETLLTTPQRNSNSRSSMVGNHVSPTTGEARA